jgi:hypothetical protein
MNHTYITVVIIQGGNLRVVGDIPASHKQAFEESFKKGLELTFPIFNTRIIVTPSTGGKTILVPK